MAIKHTIRTQSGGRRAVELTRATAIKFFCPECMGGRTIVSRNYAHFPIPTQDPRPTGEEDRGGHATESTY